MQTLKEIGIDNIKYEEFFITSYDTEINGLYNLLSEYENVDELNYLASKLNDMNEHEIEIFEAAIELGDYCSDLKTLINLTENLNCFDYIKGIHNDYDLGYYWIKESGCYDTSTMGKLSNYIDYESFGRDVSLEESGTYTKKGYIYENYNSFDEEYDGIDIPDEYKVFATPKQKILKIS